MKRLFDFIVSLSALLFFSPVYLLIALLVKIKIGSPVFFSQQRPGKNAIPFEMYKFRTMNQEKDSNGSLLSDEQRMTRVGAWLRATSLDELPEFWNVLKGDMSFVGPRPLLMEYLPLYNEVQFKRHDLKPGITGWAQVNGRNNISWEDKFNLDIWYVENQSFWVDLKIIFLTIKKVISRDGITLEGRATTEKFIGSKK